MAVINPNYVLFVFNHLRLKQLDMKTVKHFTIIEHYIYKSGCEDYRSRSKFMPQIVSLHTVLYDHITFRTYQFVNVNLNKCP